MAEEAYGGIDRTPNKWWKSSSDGPSREYTEEELELLRRKMTELEESMYRSANEIMSERPKRG